MVLPRTPVNETGCGCRTRRQQPPEPLDDQLPRGPDPPPARVHALALEAPATITIAAMAAVPRYVLIESMRLSSLLLRHIGVRRNFAPEFCGGIAGHRPGFVTFVSRAPRILPVRGVCL